jgi:hypothetical protein
VQVVISQPVQISSWEWIVMIINKSGSGSI